MKEKVVYFLPHKYVDIDSLSFLKGIKYEKCNFETCSFSKEKILINDYNQIPKYNVCIIDKFQELLKEEKDIILLELLIFPTEGQFNHICSYIEKHNYKLIILYPDELCYNDSSFKTTSQQTINKMALNTALKMNDLFTMNVSNTVLFNLYSTEAIFTGNLFDFEESVTYKKVQFKPFKFLKAS